MATTRQLSCRAQPRITNQPRATRGTQPATRRRCPRLVLSGLITLALSAGIARALDVKALWEKHCTQCHGPDGKGLTKMGKKLSVRDLTDAKVQADVTDQQMRRNIKDGVKDATGKVRMKPAENVSDAEIDALISYVRTLKNK